MTKIINIWLLVLLAVGSLQSQSNREYCSISYPDFIAVNSSFDISIITSKIFSEAEYFDIYFSIGNGIEIKTAELRSELIKKKLNIAETEYPGISAPTYRITIDLRDSSFAGGKFFQIVTAFKNESITSSEIKLAGIYRKGTEILGYSRNSEDGLFQQQIEPYFTEINLDFYRPQKFAGRALQLNSSAYLEIKFPNTSLNYFFAEFWLKLNNSDISVLSIEEINTRNKFFTLNYNPFSMLYLSNSGTPLEFSEPRYLSKKLWNYIKLVCDKKSGTISIYCNGDLLGKGNLQPGIAFSDLNLKFINESDNKSFVIEQLQLFESNLVEKSSGLNVSNGEFDPDTRTKYISMAFDNTEDFNALLQKRIIEFGGIQLIKSDAPVFTPSPELNISVYRNSYELSWQPGGTNIASGYVLEKSSGKNAFEEIVKLQATDENEKIYSYTDAIDESAGIVYYRIKQINKDGSLVYSGTVKVGQGKVNDPIVVEQNFPNPFNPKTSIVVDLNETSEVEIIVYSLEGREIKTLHDGILEKGQHKFNFDGSELPSGIYLYKVQTPSFTQTRKMILAK